MTVADKIIAIFAKKGQTAYFGEPVSQLEHALQAAHFATRDNAPDELVVAALLHDIGHLIHELPEDIADQGIDARHEQIGEVWLSKRFGSGVCEPVRLHVAAKRYLCATDPEYLSRLSTASVQSLHLQGGAMQAQDVTSFESNPHFREAVRLRLWDDEAKIPALRTAELASYRNLINQTVARRATS